MSRAALWTGRGQVQPVGGVRVIGSLDSTVMQSSGGTYERIACLGEPHDARLEHKQALRDSDQRLSSSLAASRRKRVQ